MGVILADHFTASSFLGFLGRFFRRFPCTPTAEAFRISVVSSLLCTTISRRRSKPAERFFDIHPAVPSVRGTEGSKGIRPLRGAEITLWQAAFVRGLPPGLHLPVDFGLIPVPSCLEASNFIVPS
jgi:hypothetical protein